MKRIGAKDVAIVVDDTTPAGRLINAHVSGLKGTFFVDSLPLAPGGQQWFCTCFHHPPDCTHIRAVKARIEQKETHTP